MLEMLTNVLYLKKRRKYYESVGNLVTSEVAIIKAHLIFGAGI